MNRRYHLGAIENMLNKDSAALEELWYTSGTGTEQKDVVCTTVYSEE